MRRGIARRRCAKLLQATDITIGRCLMRVTGASGTSQGAISDPAILHDYGSDIYTEADSHDDTLNLLGPLRPLAGIWSSADGADVHPIGPGSDISGPVDQWQDIVLVMR
jgi:hypothetical protein